MAGSSEGKVELDIRLIMAELGLDGDRFINELQAVSPMQQDRSSSTLPNNGSRSYRLRPAWNLC